MVDLAPVGGDSKSNEKWQTSIREGVKLFCHLSYADLLLKSADGLWRYADWFRHGGNTADRGSRSLRGSFEFDEHLALLHRVAHADVDLGDLAGDGRRDDRFHLHGFEDQQYVVDLDGLAGLGVDLRHRAGKRAAADLALVADRSARNGRGHRTGGGGRGGLYARMTGVGGLIVTGLGRFRLEDLDVDFVL